MRSMDCVKYLKLLLCYSVTQRRNKVELTTRTRKEELRKVA